ncbi:MAG: UDP-N-acetylmuramate--L-alanine ligase [Patescibacteria group bacterium]
MFKAKHVHFIGVGGIGVSAVAKMVLGRKVAVSGSDLNDSALIDELRKGGAVIYLGHDAKNVPADCELVVYTNALREDNPELLEAEKRGLKKLSYPEALGEISRGQFVIAISGNAGKTTTTAMIGQILINADLHPTIIVGSLANFVDQNGKTEKTNFVLGNGKYFVVEADEYKRAFLNLEPNILVINNIEADHLDYYKNLDDIQNAFAELVTKIPKNGFVICRAKDKNVMPLLARARAKILDYTDTSLSNYSISLPGEHNRDNAKAAIAVADILGIEKEVTKKSLSNFIGPWRRFEYKGKTKSGAILYDDYAHNPRKIRAVIAGAKEKFPEKRIVIIFQPHLFSRTKHLLGELSESFLGADRVIVTPIYAARESVDPSITHSSLRDAIIVSQTVKQVETADSFNSVKDMLETEGEGTVCLTIGAGDIHSLSNLILDKS